MTTGSDTFWRGRTAVVTGACGFIGSHLAESLAILGASVKAVVFYDARGRRGWMDSCTPEAMKSIQVLSGDIRDTEWIRNVISPGDHVFHLAALIGIPYSYYAPRSYVDTNVTGTLNILESARTQKASGVVVVSTSEVYGSALRVPIDEEHPLQAQSPYSASKIAAEKLAESYRCSFDLPVSVARPFNTFGPRQSPRAVIPTVIIQALSGANEINLGDTSTTRDFNYVEDTANGLIAMARYTDAVEGPVNIGSSTERSVLDVVNTVAKLLERPIAVRADPGRTRPSASEVRRLCADNRKIRKLTGWTPGVSFEEGLRRTLEWFKDKTHEYECGRYYV